LSDNHPPIVATFADQWDAGLGAGGYINIDVSPEWESRSRAEGFFLRSRKGQGPRPLHLGVLLLNPSTRKGAATGKHLNPSPRPSCQLLYLVSGSLYCMEAPMRTETGVPSA
jgi:hypothetical protein